MAKVCNIDSNLIENGADFMYGNADLVSWHSPLEKLENGARMFYNCSALTSFNDEMSENFLYNLSDAVSMFQSCSNLKYFHQYMPRLHKANNMFFESGIEQCRIEDVSNSLYDCTAMFYRCRNLRNVLICGRSLGVDAQRMFYGCSALKSIYTDDGMLFSNTINATEMFAECFNLSYEDSYWECLTCGKRMFNKCSKLESIQINSFRNLEDGTEMFQGCISLKSCYWSLPSLQNGTRMFAEAAIQDINFYAEDWDKLTNATEMFRNSYITIFNGSLPSCKDCGGMFENSRICTCYSFSGSDCNLSIPLCEYCGLMFKNTCMGQGGSSKLTIYNKDKLTNTTEMFYGCQYLKNVAFCYDELGERCDLPLSHAYQMFELCEELQQVTGMSSKNLEMANFMFNNCFSLHYSEHVFDTAGFNRLREGYSMFRNCGVSSCRSDYPTNSDTDYFVFMGDLPVINDCSYMFACSYGDEMIGSYPRLELQQLNGDIANDIDGLSYICNKRHIDTTHTIDFLTKMAKPSTSGCSGDCLGNISCTEDVIDALVSNGWIPTEQLNSPEPGVVKEKFELTCDKGHTVHLIIIHEGDYTTLGSPYDIVEGSKYIPDASSWYDDNSAFLGANGVEVTSVHDGYAWGTITNS